MERPKGRLQPELRVPPPTPAPSAPSLARERILTSQSLVPPPQAPPPLTSEPRAGGGSQLSPNRALARERAGGLAKRAAAADGGRSSAPDNSRLPASPAAGQPQVQPGNRPARDPGRCRAAGPFSRWTPTPKDGRGCLGVLDCTGAGLGLSRPPMPQAQLPLLSG